MSFVSVSFLIFLPIVFALYWGAGKWHGAQNLLLLLASYVFYAWWDWRFLLLILITSASSYGSGILIGRCSQKRLLLTANIVLNLGILAFFKYYNFFADNLDALFRQMGYVLDVPTLQLILPVGISFYTFQSLSYSIDVYRGKIQPTTDLIAFFAYIAFFPQLVAGPIERATSLLPQMLERRKFVYDEAVDGLRRMLWGFFKKMVVADNCAMAVNMIWDNYQETNALMLLTGMVLFSFQIYCDFSGYSDIAIGTAKLFGIRLMENFCLPYFSRSIAEFWRRWHISLMTWFRDYLYIPLGGSRVGALATMGNVFIVFLLSGLWHGANWTFVAWGGYNACLLTIGRGLTKSSSRIKDSKVVWRELPSVVFTFLLVAVGWVVFRANTITDAMAYMNLLINRLAMGEFGPMLFGKWALCYCALLVVVEWIQRDVVCPLQLNRTWLGQYAWVRWSVYYLVFFLTFFARGEEQTFIYFQF